MSSRNRPSTKPFQKAAKIKQKVENAEDLAFLPGDNLVVADKLGKKIRIFDKGGKLIKTLVQGVKPLGIAVNRSGLVAFTDVNNGRSEVKIMTESGDVVNHWGGDLVWKPRSLEITNKGHLIVTDFHEHARQRVGVYTMDGQSLRKFGQGGDDPFKPWYMTVDPFDRVLLADKDKAVVKIYDSNNGTFLKTIDEKSDGLRRGLEPRGLATDAQGNILVCDYGSNRVAVFSPDGRFINNMLDTSDGLSNPYSIEFSRSGYLAVGCNKPNGVLKKIRLYKVPQSNTKAATKALD